MVDNKKILIVEDNELNLELISDILKIKGYQIISANNGKDAIRLAKETHPDLILMDIQLPVMDGYEATRRIKSDPEFKAIPIIAVTSFTMKGDKEKVMEAGCDGYIVKPIDIKRLPELVKEYLQKNKKNRK